VLGIIPLRNEIGNYPDIRMDLCIDYLVDSYYDESNDTLLLIGGKHDGVATIISLEPNNATNICNLSNGHRSTIRCARFKPESSSLAFLLTGGEDGRVCLWSPPCERSNATEDIHVSGGKTQRGGAYSDPQKSLLFKPY